MSALVLRTATLAALAASLVTLAAGCQQPIRCGSINEYCCVDDFGGGYCLGGTGARLRCDVGANLCLPETCPGTTGICDIGTQNCPDGSSCRITTGTNVECSAIGSGVDQSPCAFNDECASGYYCSPLSGRCHPQCCGPDTDCNPGQACVPTGPSMPGPGLCLGSPCDPITGGGCAEGAGCYAATNQGGAWLTLCLPAGGTPTGGPCTTFTDCAPGNACTTAGTCVALCRPSAASCACTAIEGANDLGFCG